MTRNESMNDNVMRRCKMYLNRWFINRIHVIYQIVLYLLNNSDIINHVKYRID